MASATDKQVKDLIEKIKRQKVEIARADRPNWRTNCSFSDGAGGPPMNLQVQADLGQLIMIAAKLMMLAEAYRKAGDSLGVDKVPDFMWQGFSLADWLEDIKTRVAKVQVAARRKKLEALEARLNSIVSPELRAELELQAITEELSSS